MSDADEWSCIYCNACCAYRESNLCGTHEKIRLKMIEAYKSHPKMIEIKNIMKQFLNECKVSFTEVMYYGLKYNVFKDQCPDYPALIIDFTPPSFYLKKKNGAFTEGNVLVSYGLLENAYSKDIINYYDPKFFDKLKDIING